MKMAANSPQRMVWVTSIILQPVCPRIWLTAETMPGQSRPRKEMVSFFFFGGYTLSLKER